MCKCFPFIRCLHNFLWVRFCKTCLEVCNLHNFRSQQSAANEKSCAFHKKKTPAAQLFSKYFTRIRLHQAKVVHFHILSIFLHNQTSKELCKTRQSTPFLHNLRQDQAHSHLLCFAASYKVAWFSFFKRDISRAAFIRGKWTPVRKTTARFWVNRVRYFSLDDLDFLSLHLDTRHRNR